MLLEAEKVNSSPHCITDKLSKLSMFTVLTMSDQLRSYYPYHLATFLLGFTSEHD